MNNNDYIIRPETPNDYRCVEEMAREAFWNLSVPGCSEHYFIHVLRKHPAFIPELDFVLESDGEILGCVMYSRSELMDDEGKGKTVLTMGPLCVRPGHQRKGIGKRLLEHTFALAKDMGYDVVINFGNPDNYVARGYKSCKRYNITFRDFGSFPAALLVKELIPGALDGRHWRYFQNDADAPCEDEEAVEKYDALFPKKEKAWQPSQEEFYIHSHSELTW